MTIESSLSGASRFCSGCETGAIFFLAYRKVAEHFLPVGSA